MLLPTTAPHCRTPESLDDSVPTLSLLLFEASVATIVIALIATTLLGTFPTHFLYITITSLLALALGVSTARKRKQNNICKMAEMKVAVGRDLATYSNLRAVDEHLSLVEMRLRVCQVTRGQ